MKLLAGLTFFALPFLQISHSYTLRFASLVQPTSCCQEASFHRRVRYHGLPSYSIDTELWPTFFKPLPVSRIIEKGSPVSLRRDQEKLFQLPPYPGFMTLYSCEQLSPCDPGSHASVFLSNQSLLLNPVASKVFFFRSQTGAVEGIQKASSTMKVTLSLLKKPYLVWTPPSYVGLDPLVSYSLQLLFSSSFSFRFREDSARSLYSCKGTLLDQA